jgi:hypothetical protein
MKNKLRTIYMLFCVQVCFAQAKVLNADGPGNTYELINSVLAPGHNAVEPPDCAHASFGRHIEEVWDKELNKYVFKFHIHAAEDNDRFKKFDRQRNEIKTYNKSQDNLIGTVGETVIYKWKFKLDANFQPSDKFTHIHQIKAYGGAYDDMPVITLTLRGGKQQHFQVLHSDSISSIEVARANLGMFKGTWVEVTETITYGVIGRYNVVIKKVTDDSVLLTYSNNHINTWRTGAEGVRPKWGIYRSLLNRDMLRDEEVLFADFSIEEVDASATKKPSTEHHK